jgi:carboxymethylenebutenolidase
MLGETASPAAREREETNVKIDLAAVFDEHVADEFVLKDVEATMRTMADDPYVWHVAPMTGGAGFEGVKRFYSEQFIGRFPDDVRLTQISRTVGDDRVIDELIVSFTHDVEIPAMLPGVPPTGRPVELPLVVVMGFQDGKVAHEHIYWDQGSLLVQVGLLESTRLPVFGSEQAAKLRELAGV